MRGYIVRRLLLTVPTLLGVTLLVSAMVHLLPGDAVTMMMQDYGSYAKSADDLRAQLGLTRPFYVQYLTWLGGIAHGDLGRSLRNQTPIAQDLAGRLPVTFELGALGLLISLLIAIPLGIYSAVRQDTLSDYLARSLAIAVLAIPGFWLATLAITLPAIWFRWTPPLRYTQLLDDPATNLGQMLPPALILGVGLSGSVMRLTRAQMLEVLRQEYIRTARSKGLAERAVMVRHALRNAIIPVVTLLGLQVTVLISGTVVLESIFVIPGMGRYLLEALTYRDYPAVQAVVLLFATLIVLVNLAVDLFCAWLDPRIRYG
ncbi:MAG TPA: ABC transporter permease [Thermomicrobiales bacterium]|nr:ABC transporter permease [Thermomicrobiales bacterium]